MFRSYAPKDVVVSWNGIPITGFAAGTFITMKRSTESKKKTVGSQGDVCLTMSADKTGEIELTLMQTAPSNNLLSAALHAEEKLKVPTVGVLMISDPSGSMLALSKNAFLMSFPNSDLGDDATDRTWMFGCEDLDYSSAIGYVPIQF